MRIGRFKNHAEHLQYPNGFLLDRPRHLLRQSIQVFHFPEVTKDTGRFYLMRQQDVPCTSLILVIAKANWMCIWPWFAMAILLESQGLMCPRQVWCQLNAPKGWTARMAWAGPQPWRSIRHVRGHRLLPRIPHYAKKWLINRVIKTEIWYGYPWNFLLFFCHKKVNTVATFDSLLTSAM